MLLLALTVRTTTALLRRPRSLTETAICEGLAYLQPDTLRVGDVRQLLTMREFGILWHLTSHEGRWVDARNLALAVLGDANESHTENMRVHVSNLRYKLRHLSDVFAIESERHPFSRRPKSSFFPRMSASRFGDHFSKANREKFTQPEIANC